MADVGLRERRAMHIVLAMPAEQHDDASTKSRRKRSRRLHIRLTPGELEKLSYLAYDSEMSMSDFVRHLIREEHDRDRAAAARLHAANEVLGVAERFVAEQRARH